MRRYCWRLTSSAWRPATTTSTSTTWPTRSNGWSLALASPSQTTAPPGTPTCPEPEDPMADNTLSILKPSVNNLSVRIFVRAAGLDFEEVDVWGQQATDEFYAKDPSRLTPLLECAGLPNGVLWESCAIMQYLCNKHGLDRFYPTEPEQRAMVDSAMAYHLATLYPLVARATYPTLGFGQYAGEVGTASGASDEMKLQAAKEAEAALAGP